MTEQEIEDRARMLYNQNNAWGVGAQRWGDLGDVIRRAFMSEARRLAERDQRHGD